MNAHPLHILQTCLSSSWGGLEMQALEVSKQLKAGGHVVWLACPGGSRLASTASRQGIAVLPLSSRRYFSPSDIWRLRRFIRDEGMEIIHCHVSKDLSTLVPAMKLSGRRIPIILSKRIGSGISKKDVFHRFLYAHVTRVFAISDFVQGNVLETTPMTPDRVVTIHDAVDTMRFSLDNVNRGCVCKEFEINDDTVLVGFVGRFSPGKGHEEFLTAANVLRVEFPRLHFLIVGEASEGEDAYAESIKALCTSLTLDDVVTFAGYRSDIPEVMAAFDVFAFPSHAESFGVALIEAMAMERPVVATRRDGILDIIVDGETGFLVTPKSAAELCDALRRLIADPALRRRMGKAGRARVEKLFSQEAQTQKMERIYQELIHQPH